MLSRLRRTVFVVVIVALSACPEDKPKESVTLQMTIQPVPSTPARPSPPQVVCKDTTRQLVAKPLSDSSVQIVCEPKIPPK